MQGNTNTNRLSIVIKHDFFLDQPHLSIPNEIRFSNTAVTVDIAAKIINKKKSVPHNPPKGIWLNTFGSVSKISPGPPITPPFTGNANAAGITISPAMNATPVSRAAIETDSPKRLLSFLI